MIVSVWIIKATTPVDVTKESVSFDELHLKYLIDQFDTSDRMNYYYCLSTV